ncbi:MAG: phosphoribosyltransferase [Caulobacter sp.]|nr:phosphoribosyltransferase [Caulobacter sp.]
MDDQPLFFADRTEAGRLLADHLARRNYVAPVIYALPRGGVPVAFEVASRLNAPLDLALVRKVGAPNNPELALAAVMDGDHPITVVNEDIMRLTGATEDYLRREAAVELAEIERRRRLYFGDRPRPSPRGRTVIIVDDGLATGATARVAVRGLRGQGAAKVILAAPVAPPETTSLLRNEVDELVCLTQPDRFAGVGAFYGDFHQLTDEEVLALLARATAFGT